MHANGTQLPVVMVPVLRKRGSKVRANMESMWRPMQGDFLCLEGGGGGYFFKG